MDAAEILQLSYRQTKRPWRDMVDDAMDKEETLWAAAGALRLWIENYGVPLALYTDWKNLYKVAPTPKQQLRAEAPLTQFGRMCAQLGIRIIAASSPQAKGRVERKHGVHQDRLVKKFRRKNIQTYEAANAYLQAEHLPALNQRFAQDPARPEDYHRPKPSAAELDAIFRLETERWVSNDWVVRYHGRFLQLLPPRRCDGPRAKAQVHESEDGTLEVRYRGERLAWEEILASQSSRSAAEEPAIHVPYSRPRPKPGKEHPYKRGAEDSIRPMRWKMLKRAVAARAAVGASPTPSGCAPAPTSPSPSHPPRGHF